MSEASATAGLVETRKDGRVALLRLMDEAGQNALDEALVSAFCAAIDRLSQDTSVHALVLAGLPKVFSAGASHALLETLLDGKVLVEELGLPSTILAFPVPVVAALRGDAVGGGFALGLAADVVVMAERARFGLNFMDLGLTPGMGVTWLAPHRLGPAVGDELMYSTEYRRGAAFRHLPGINHVVPAEDVEDLAFDLALRIAEKPRDALVLLKQTQAAPRLAAFHAAREAEMAMHKDRLARPETVALIRGNYVK